MASWFLTRNSTLGLPHSSAPLCFLLPVPGNCLSKIVHKGLSSIRTRILQEGVYEHPGRVCTIMCVCMCVILHTCHLPHHLGAIGIAVTSRHPPKPGIVHTAVTKPQDSQLPSHDSWNPAHFHAHTFSTHCMPCTEQKAVGMTQDFQHHLVGRAFLLHA